MRQRKKNDRLTLFRREARVNALNSSLARAVIT